MRHPGKQRRGFTILELAIVLMVISIVTGTIWVAGQHVWNNYRVYRVNQQIAQVVQNIRGYYGATIQTFGTPGPGFTNGKDITTTLDGFILSNTEIFPPEMRRNPSAAPGSTPIDHALNNSYPAGVTTAPSWGSFHVLVENNVVSGNLDAFRLEIQGLSSATCINLLMTAPLTSDVIGFVQVGTGGMTNKATITQGVSATAGVTPMTLATANTWCATATEVDFDFALHN